jgi:hypothetical protein
LGESHHRFDDAEHRLRGLLAQTVGVGFSGAGGGAATSHRSNRTDYRRAPAQQIRK